MIHVYYCLHHHSQLITWDNPEGHCMHHSFCLAIEITLLRIKSWMKQLSPANRAANMGVSEGLAANPVLRGRAVAEGELGEHLHACACVSALSIQVLSFGKAVGTVSQSPIRPYWSACQSFSETHLAMTSRSLIRISAWNHQIANPSQITEGMRLCSENLYINHLPGVLWNQADEERMKRKTVTSHTGGIFGKNTSGKHHCWRFKAAGTHH